MGQKIDVERARRLVGEWKASGLSMRAFAKRERVSVSSLYRWRERFGREPEFVPVVVRPTVIETSSEPEPFVVDLRGGHSLRVVPGFDGAELARLIAVLEVDPC